MRSIQAKILFLSTPSARRATVEGLHMSDAGIISIHALREEGDRFTPSQRLRPLYFYPRPPRGGRRVGNYTAEQFKAISIHALREEGDCRT